MEENIQFEKIPEWAFPPSTDDIVEEIRWWEPQNIPWQIVRELRRRKNSVNLGLNGSDKVSFNFATEHEKYRGPMTPWIRVFSNGTGRVNIPSITPSKYLYKNGEMPIYDGFILEGEKDFYKAYGYKQVGNSVLQDIAIIGYQANGAPHYIDKKYRNDTSYNVAIECSKGEVKFPQNSSVPSVLPPPGITSINIKTNKDMMSNATINWKCYGLAQLEYMMPFFLTPKINVFIEFGWNLFDIKSLLNLSKTECYDLVKEPQKAISRYYQSFGNYGLVNGIIWKYNFNTNDGFIYNCSTEVYSRQAMWAGWRPDLYVSEKVKTKEDNGLSAPPDAQQYVNLKDFFRNYLQFTKDIIRDKENFIDWILNNIKTTKILKPETINVSKIIDKLGLQGLQPGQTETIGNIFNPPPSNKINLGPDNVNRQDPKLWARSNLFYGGKPENRVFMGRYDGIYDGLSRPIKSARTEIKKRDGEGGMEFEVIGEQPQVPINYGTGKYLRNIYKEIDYRLTDFSQVELETESELLSKLAPSKLIPPNERTNIVTKRKSNLVDIISDLDNETDFDGQESNNDEVWYQLDFVFELINLFCSVSKTKQNYIDISDVIISAHPNLISCDKNVLIPNSIAPKINYGKPVFVGGFLPREEATDENKFYNPNLKFYWADLRDTIENGSKNEIKIIQNKINDPDCIIDNKLSTEYSLWKAAFKAKEVFKTFSAYRDNLDLIINKLYYDRLSVQTPLSKQGTAAFPYFLPFHTDKKIDKKIKNRTPYYYGFLKHIYISKSALARIGDDESLKTLEQIVRKILNIINESVADFWKLDVVLGPNGGLKIIDKNLTLPKESKIYMFDLASTSNMIKKIDFNVTLTNEQTNQVLYGSGNNSETYANSISTVINDKKLSIQDKIFKITQYGNSLPSIVFEDRLDSESMKEYTSKSLENLNKVSENIKNLSDVPAGPIKDQNLEIRVLQKHGKHPDVLTMTFTTLKTGESPLTLANRQDGSFFGRKNWVYLNLPPTLKPKLLQMLDDGDTVNNDAKYSGPADNFTLSLTFDGIMGFRMFQHIAISNLPKPYVPGNVIFMITEVEHQINSGKWETVVTALLKAAPDKRYKYIPI